MLETSFSDQFIEESIDCSNILPGDKRVLLRNNCRMLVSLGHSIHVEARRFFSSKEFLLN